MVVGQVREVVRAELVGETIGQVRGGPYPRSLDDFGGGPLLSPRCR